MATTIITTRSELRHLGWSLYERLFVSLDGRRLYLVYCRRGTQSFSASGPTRRQAWSMAAQLAGCLRSRDEERAAIVPFRGGGINAAWRRHKPAWQEIAS
jgi:hypothetical protein